MHGPPEPDDVDLAVLVLTERRDAQLGVEHERLRGSARGRVELKDLPRAEVAKHVRPLSEGAARAPVGVSSGDGAAPARMIVFEDGTGSGEGAAQCRIVARAQGALENAPTVIAPEGDEVDLFPSILAHVSDDQLA